MAEKRFDSHKTQGRDFYSHEGRDKWIKNHLRSLEQCRATSLAVNCEDEGGGRGWCRRVRVPGSRLAYRSAKASLLTCRLVFLKLCGLDG